jgi:hypothetical protein
MFLKKWNYAKHVSCVNEAIFIWQLEKQQTNIKIENIKKRLKNENWHWHTNSILLDRGSDYLEKIDSFLDTFLNVK